jgi:bifunctional non-homologous end joining protein LigD
MNANDSFDLLDGEERALLRVWPGGDWIAPMLATLTDARFSDPGWVFERKLDGVRVIAGRDSGEPALWSRNHKRVNASYREVADALAQRAPQRFLIDGEVVAFEGDQTSFALLQSRMHRTDPRAAQWTGVEVFFYVFDFLALGGVDLTRLPLRCRKRLLHECFDFVDPLRYSRHRVGDGVEFFRQACDRGWEGLIAKRADAPYHSGRSRDWLKFKCVADQEFVIGGFTDPQGSRFGFGALLVGYYDNGRLRYAGKVGTGYDERTLRDLRSRLDGLVRKDSPFADTPRERGVHWVRPELVAQVGFTEWTADGRLRHPRFAGLRDDKRPDEVVRERQGR